MRVDATNIQGAADLDLEECDGDLSTFNRLLEVD